MWSREIAIGEFCRLGDQRRLFNDESKGETYLFVMTSRRSVRETRNTIIAPVRLAMYETTNPSHTPNVYPHKTIRVE